jgi:hypothetical protein
VTDRTDPWTRLDKLWPLLAITRIPGTRRPWRPSELGPGRRAERDRQLREERLTAEAFLGSPPAPVHLDVIDTLGRLHADLCAAAVSLGIGDQSVIMRGSAADPRPLLELCRDAARDQPDGIVADDAAWAMLHAIEHALGEIWSGQKLAAICPWCHGGTARRPTWRVRILPPDLPAIVCESGTCEPGRDAGTWWREHPAWPMWEWDWLAGMLQSEEERQAARRGELTR